MLDVVMCMLMFCIFDYVEEKLRYLQLSERTLILLLIVLICCCFRVEAVIEGLNRWRLLWHIMNLD